MTKPGPPNHLTPTQQALAGRLKTDVLALMKQSFVGKDEVIDLLGVCLVARENLFILGPPGTAKSALVQDLARRIEGQVFDYLLTRFTEPNEIFGPFDIRQLRDGNLVTNTEGMLPEATFVFLDELLNANSAILNSLLMVLNERVFRRGRETRSLPTLLVVGASNRLPEEEALRALFDRFLLRVNCENVDDESFANVLTAGWQLEQDRHSNANAITVDEVRQLQSLVQTVDVGAVREEYVELVFRLRNAGIDVSDRRAVKLQRLMAASAILCGRSVVHQSDMWVLRYIWDNVEQQEVLNSIVQDAVEKQDEGKELNRHPRSLGQQIPDPETLARDIDSLAARLSESGMESTDYIQLKDQLGVLASRCEWIGDKQQREFLEQKVEQIWNGLT